eukprot:scaffold115181_cov15-Tisochrysis_lutea.AAC.1
MLKVSWGLRGPVLLSHLRHFQEKKAFLLPPLELWYRKPSGTDAMYICDKSGRIQMPLTSRRKGVEAQGMYPLQFN